MVLLKRQMKPFDVLGKGGKDPTMAIFFKFYYRVG